MVKITNAILFDVRFQTPVEIQKLFSDPGEKALNMGVQNNMTIDQSLSSLRLKISVIINQSEMYQCEYLLRLNAVEPTTELSELVNDKENSAILLRVLGGICNQVNSMLASTPIGPLPIHAHLLLEQVKNIATKKTT